MPSPVPSHLATMLLDTSVRTGHICPGRGSSLLPDSTHKTYTAVFNHLQFRQANSIFWKSYRKFVYLAMRLAMSYEPSRSKPNDTDIYWCVVYQLRALEYTVQQVSDNLGISVSTVRRIGQLFDSTGSSDKQACPDRRLALKALTTYDEFIVLELVLQGLGFTSERYVENFNSPQELKCQTCYSIILIVLGWAVIGFICTSSQSAASCCRISS